MTLTDGNDVHKISREEFEAGASTIDTEYFGISCAKVVLKKACLDPERQNELLSFLRDFEFVTIINGANDPSNNRWLGEATSSFLTDLNMQLGKKVSTAEGDNEGFAVITEKLPENDQVIRLAETSFGFSRFLNDPYLPAVKARNIYADIARNAFGRAGCFFVIIDKAEVIAGFLLFSIDASSSSSRIELLAMDQSYQGYGIGRSLIRSMEQHLATRGIEQIQVGTQLNNIDAMNFYVSYGFRYAGCNSIYHYWPLRPWPDSVDHGRE